MWQRTIDCLGTAVRIQTSLAELEQQLTSVLRTYADTAREPDIAYVLDVVDGHVRLNRDGAVLNHQAAVLDLVPALELDLYRSVIQRAPGLTLHAGAVVGQSGAAIVFTGHSGSGKSTLVRALLQRGFRYLTEECVAMLADRRCAGLARALHVEDPSLAVPEGFQCAEYVLHDAPEKRLRLFHPPEDRIFRGEARSAAIVAIDHPPDASNTLVPLTGGAALAAVWPMVFRQDPGSLAFASRALDGVPAFQLHTSTPERALDHALALATELGV